MRLSLLALALALLPGAAAQEAPKAFLGVSIHPGHSALRGKGVLVTAVHPETSAAKAGILPGDVVVRFAGSEPTDGNSLIAALAGHAVGAKVPVALRRDGAELEVECELAARPAEVGPAVKVEFPDPLDQAAVEKQFRIAERAYLTRDFARLKDEATSLSAQVSFFLSTGLAGLAEGDAESVRSEALQQRRRIDWYRSLAEAGIAAPINVYAGTIGAGGGSVEERIARLVAQLGDEDFQRREDATRALRAIGEKARKQLEAAAASEDMEVQWRARMVLEQIAGQVLPASRPPADYRPVAVTASAIEEDRIDFDVELGDTLQAEGPLNVVLVREGKEVGTLWVKDVELGRCQLHRQSDEDLAVEAGDRLLWIFKIAPQE